MPDTNQNVPTNDSPPAISPPPSTPPLPPTAKNSRSVTTAKPPSSRSPMDPKKKTLVIGGIAIVVVLIIGAIAYAAVSKPTPQPTPTPIAVKPSPTPTPEPKTIPSLLNGVEVESSLATRHPLAIMIENLLPARPQAGLGDASIVYEAITEGGITRFMAVYGATLPAKAGPVRSARSVFIDYAEEYTPGSAYYAHVGGASDALGKISGDHVYDLNQFAIGAKAFQRFPKAGVASEHTMYTFPEKLYEAAQGLGYKTNSDFRPWKFKNDAAIADRAEAQTITIPFSSDTYTVKYVYDKTTNTYKRFLAGTEHKDANTGTQLAPKTVVVTFVNYENLTGSKKNVQKVGTIGEGSAKVFMDGKVIEAKWKKPSSPGRTIYTDAATGKEIELNRGQIFIELPKTGTAITVQ